MPELKDIKERETDFNGTVGARMDVDRDLYESAKYVMTAPNDKTGEDEVVPGVINITLPYGKLYGNKVVSILLRVKEQMLVTVKGRESKEVSSRVERAYQAIFDAANARLRKMCEVPLDHFAIEQSCVRGAMAYRVNLHYSEDGKTIIPDIMPMDTRYFTYETGEGGLDWTSYPMTMTRREILGRYPDLESNLGIKKTFILRDVWDKEINTIYVDDLLAKEQPNPYGYIPVVYERVAFGSMLKEKGHEAFQGESIFYLARELIDEMQRLMTIAMSHNFRNFKMNYVYKANSKNDPPPEPPNGINQTTVVEKGEEYDPIISQDINKAYERLESRFYELYQACTLSLTEYGTNQFPMAAIALIELGQNRDEIFLPRLNAYGNLKIDTCKMIKKQVEQIGGTIDFGDGITVDSADLKGDYSVDFQYHSKDPKLDVALTALGRNYLEIGVSKKSVFTNVLQLDNPDEELMMSDIEQLELSDEALFLYNRGHKLIDAERYFEAERVLRKLESLLSQEAMAGGVVQQAGQNPAPKKIKGESLMPLLTERAGTRGNGNGRGE